MSLGTVSYSHFVVTIHPFPFIHMHNKAAVIIKYIHTHSTRQKMYKIKIKIKAIDSNKSTVAVSLTVREIFSVKE